MSKHATYAEYHEHCEAELLRERIAKALGWTVAEAQSCSLLALRSLLRDHPKLVHEINLALKRIT